MSNKLSLLAIYKTPRKAPHFATLFSCRWMVVSWFSGHGMYVRLSLTGVRVGFEVGGSVEVAPCGGYRCILRRFVSMYVYVARKMTDPGFACDSCQTPRLRNQDPRQHDSLYRDSLNKTCRTTPNRLAVMQGHTRL